MEENNIEEENIIEQKNIIVAEKNNMLLNLYSFNGRIIRCTPFIGQKVA